MFLNGARWINVIKPHGIPSPPVQRCVYVKSHTVPRELAGMIDQETFDKSRVYQLDKSCFSLFHDFFKQIEFLVSGHRADSL